MKRKGITIKPRAHQEPATPSVVTLERPSGHAHHWVIASPDGAMSWGTCKVCSARKEFPNSAEDGLWEREVPQSRWTGRTEYSPPVASGF